MRYKEFESIFNETIFQKSKSDLVRKIAEHPQRYTGLFRPTKPKAKIIQNLSQSHEIRFGDAFEKLIAEYLRDNGFNILEKKFQYQGYDLEMDQLFSKGNTLFFVEQKLRDDHDSTKKRGQIDNFEKKIDVIRKKYRHKKIKGLFYFIDDGLRKNKKFYQEEISKMSDDYGLSLYLSYGKDFFDKLNKPAIWNEIIRHLRKWKTSIPDLPEINFDETPRISFREIKDLKPLIYRKLFNNHDLDDLLMTLFPKMETLKLLNGYFLKRAKKEKIYATLSELCTQTMNRLKY